MIAVDIETTGTNPDKHSILAIGAVDFEHPEEQFYGECRAWDGAHVEDEALEINGFTQADLGDRSRKSEVELVQDFIAWSGDVRGWNFVGQNPFFDLSFVAAACERAGVAYPFPHRSLDTHTMAYMHLVARHKDPPFNVQRHGSAMNLDFVLKYVGIPEEPKPHNALTGAKCHAEAASRLLFGKKLLAEFDSYPIPYT